MNKKIFYLFFLCLYLVGCDQAEKLQAKFFSSTPDSVASKYLNAMYKGTLEEEYSFISDADKQFLTYEGYEEKTQFKKAISQLLADKASFKLLSTQQSNDKATVRYEATTLDVGYYIGTLFSAALAGSISPGDNANEKMFQEIQNSIKNDGPKFTTSNETLKLIKENDQWKIFLNEELKDKKNRIQNLSADADELYRKSMRDPEKMAAAFDAYKNVLALDPNNQRASNKIKELESSIERQKIAKEYISNIQLYDISSGRYDTYLDKAVPGFKFKLKNTGDKTVTKIKVALYFKEIKEVLFMKSTYFR